MEPSGKANFAAISSRSGADGSILSGNTALCFCFDIGDNEAFAERHRTYMARLSRVRVSGRKIKAWSASSRKKVDFSK